MTLNHYLPCFLLTAVALAQSADLQVAGLTGEELGQPTWTSWTLASHPHAAFQFAPLEGRHTLMFVHATIDADVSGPTTARGLIEVYPFLAPPHSTWTSSHAEFNGLPSGTTLEGSTMLVIPPARMVDHLQAFIALSPSDRPLFGPLNGTGPTQLFTQVGAFAGTSQLDERFPWGGAWSDGGRVTNVSEVGRRALLMAASQSTPGALPGMDELDDLINSEYGFVIHVQCAHVGFPSAGAPPVIKFSQSVVMRRRSLREDDGDVRRALMGPLRTCAALHDDHLFFHLAGRSEYCDFYFDHAVSGLVAFFETTTGWVTAPQLANPPGVTGTIARFSYPWNGISGFGYVALPWGEGEMPIFLKPKFNYCESEALVIHAFNVHPEHVPPQ
jgi:hypothetical protein